MLYAPVQKQHAQHARGDACPKPWNMPTRNNRDESSSYGALNLVAFQIGSRKTSALSDLSDIHCCHAGEPLLAPQEILTALLALNPKAENLPLKAIMGAITHCFAMRDADMGPAFQSEALASAMQQLVVRQVYCNQILAPTGHEATHTLSSCLMPTTQACDGRHQALPCHVRPQSGFGNPSML